MKTYLIFDGFYYKIGRSINIEKRFKTIKSNNPNAILLAYTDFDIEYKLHNKYSQYAYYNEWFLIKDDNIIKELLNEYDTKVNNNGVEANLSSKQRQSIGAKDSSNRRVTKTIKKIVDAKKLLEFMDEKPTQKMF